MYYTDAYLYYVKAHINFYADVFLWDKYTKERLLDHVVYMFSF